MIVVEPGGKVNPKHFPETKRKMIVDKIYHFPPKSSVILKRVVINLCVEIKRTKFERHGYFYETKTDNEYSI